jgi:hypothetical protein
MHKEVCYFYFKKTIPMQVTFPILLAKKICTTKKEFFLYEVNTSQEVIQYTFTNDVARYEKKFSNPACLVSDLQAKIDAQLSRFF